ncbi:MAG: hypothetical protein II844_02855 [Prevotella sp.]|nr:hypothetical protein [Prevotella sp.]
MTVIDWDRNDILNYLGTYFPRSYAEAYCIFTEFFKNHLARYANETELSLFDFGCGTGGEIIGMLDSLRGNVSCIKTVYITALDGNHSALRILERIADEYNSKFDIDISIRPLPLTIDDFYDMKILDKVLSENFDIFMTFKAICEFVTKDRFEQDNAYAHIIKTFIPKLKDNGIMVLADVSTYSDVSKEWLPKMMDEGIRQAGVLIQARNENFNQQFLVTHSHRVNDVSKIAWRII